MERGLSAWPLIHPNALTTMTTEVSIMWTKPTYEDLRIGFEVTMYFANR